MILKQNSNKGIKQNPNSDKIKLHSCLFNKKIIKQSQNRTVTIKRLPDSSSCVQFPQHQFPAKAYGANHFSGSQSGPRHIIVVACLPNLARVTRLYGSVVKLRDVLVPAYCQNSENEQID